MITNFYIAGNLVNPPKNYEELEIELKYREVKKDNDAIFFSTTKNNRWIFWGAEAQAINNIVAQGFIFEGIPFRIDLFHDGLTETVFDGYINCTDNLYTSCGEVHVTCSPKQGVDWMSDVAEGITFEKMYHDNPGFFQEKFIYPPYVLNSTPNWREAISAIISCFTTVIALVQMVKEFIKTICDFSGELFWAVILKILFECAYITVLTKICIDQTQNTILYLIQPAKYLCGMKYKDMVQAGVLALSLSGFEAPAFTSGALEKCVRMPETFDPPATNLAYEDLAKNQENVILKWFLKPGTLGLPNIGTQANVLGYLEPHADQRGYYRGTYAELLREMKLIANCKLVMDNGVLKMVRRDTITSSALYTVPDLRQDFHGYNTEDFVANIYITFAPDTNDNNTVDMYLGTAYNVSHTLKIVNDPKYKLLKGGREIRIPVAIAKRKIDLSLPEKIAKTLVPFMEKWLNHAIDFANFHIGATWNYFVDAFNFIKEKIGELVEFLVNAIEEIINAVIDFLNALLTIIHDAIQGFIDIVNSAIDVVNTLSGGSIGHVPDLGDWTIDNVNFDDTFADQVVQFFVEITVGSILGPALLGLLMADPHTMIITLLDFFGIDVPVINELQHISIKGFDEDRINMMVMENDYLHVPKLGMFTNIPPDGPLASKKVTSKFIRLHPDHEKEVSAKRLWQRFHHIDAFARTIDEVTGQTKHNQFFKYKLENVPFCFGDFQKIKNDNIINDVNGNIAELDTLTWRVYSQMAQLEYRLNKEYTITANGDTNLDLTYYEPAA